MSNWQNRPCKEKVRQYVVGIPTGPKHRAIMLPAGNALCLKAALSVGLFDDETECFCVERQPDVFLEMRKTLFTLPRPERFHSVNSDLMDLNIQSNIDYAFFDFNGVLTEPICRWLMFSFSDHIAQGCDCVFTFEYAFRNNHFVRELFNFMLSSDFFRDVIYETSYENLGVADKTIAIYMTILKFVFWQYSFNFDVPMKYRDEKSQSMFVLILKDFHRNPMAQRNEEFTNFFSNPKEVSIMTREKMVQSNAAHKAWETRRKNVEKRSKAAKKAWRTRRAKTV